MSLLPIPHPILSSGVITKCQAGPPVLFSSFPLAVYFMHGRVYMSRLLSQVVLTLRFPCFVHKSVLHICVSSSDPISVTSLITCIPPSLQDYCFLHYQICD